MLRDYYTDEQINAFTMYDKGILDKINEYNQLILQNKYTNCQRIICEDFYKKLIVSNMIAYLLDFENHQIPEIMYDLLNNETKKYYKLSLDSINNLNSKDKDEIKHTLIKDVFSKDNLEIIKEISFIDIINGGVVDNFLDKNNNPYSLAKSIQNQMSSMKSLITMETYDPDTLLSMVRKGNLHTSIIFDKFESVVYVSHSISRQNVFVFNYDAALNIPIHNDSNSINYLLNPDYAQLATVRIETSTGVGTGFFISKHGHIITCDHVAENNEEIYPVVITDQGYDCCYAKLVYTNKQLDIAIYQLDGNGTWDYYFDVEENDVLPNLGENVIVLGYPFGNELGNSNFMGANISFLKGYVSSNQKMNGNSITYIDVPVKSGNSGGPVISLKTGKVIGIVSGIKMGGKFVLREQMPYMIPIQHLRRLISKK